MSSQRRFSTSRETPQCPPRQSTPRAQAAVSGEAQHYAGSQAPPLPPMPLGLQNMEALEALGTPLPRPQTCLQLLLLSVCRWLRSRLCPVTLHPPRLEAQLTALPQQCSEPSDGLQHTHPRARLLQRLQAPCCPARPRRTRGAPQGLAPQPETSWFAPGDGHSSIPVKSYL